MADKAEGKATARAKCEAKAAANAARLKIISERRDLKDLENVVRYRTGATYRGTTSSMIPHGHGRKTYPGGSWYEGAWRNGERHGSGVFSERDASTVYDGDWRAGKKDGVGVERRTRLGNWVEYEGCWLAGAKHGEGKMRWINGRVLQGVWDGDILVKVHEDLSKQITAPGCIDPEDMSMDFVSMLGPAGSQSRR